MPAASASARARRDAAGPRLALDLALLSPAAAARVARHPAVAALRTAAGSRSRSAAEEVIWLDTPEGDLAAEGLTLEAPARGPRRRLRTLPAPGAPWLPGTPAAEAPAPAAPGEEPTGLVPFAAFSGRRTTVRLVRAEAGDAAPAAAASLALELLQGKLRAVAAERPVARLRLSGPEGQVVELARALAADLPVLPSAAALAEEGRALARGEATPRPRRRGPPDLGAAGSVEAALEVAIGHLLEVMLHQAPLCRAEAGPEGVHQTRVALRRLRSVLKAFRPAARCAEMDAFDAGLKALARRLGEARDLDVFLHAGGVGARAAEALPDDRRIAALTKALEGRRAAAYRALREALDGPGFRLLVLDGLALAVLRPWRTEGAEAAEALAEPLPDFAARLLDKRWHRLRSEGEEIRSLSAEELHALRLTAKRLRYAAELFAPLWPGKAARRFLKRLAALQEELGLANDAAVARGIVASLGPSVPAWAVGAVEGFAVARTGGARKRALSAWDDLAAAAPFWSGR
jgi:triphosphatase